jgi:hypothetical protein
MRPPRLSPPGAHREAWMLLPWYVNGTLKGAEFDLVEQHLRVCMICRRELGEQQRLAQAISESPMMEPAPQASFARLMQRIEREGPQAHRGEMDRNRHRSQWARLLERLSGARLPQRAWIAVPLLLLLMTLVPTARVWLSSPARAPQYHTLSTPNSVPAAGSNEIRVVFAKTVSPDVVRQLLRSLHGEIMAGPSASDAYTVRIATRDRSNEDMLTALLRLHRHPGVLLAEPAPPSVLPKNGPDRGH